MHLFYLIYFLSDWHAVVVSLICMYIWTAIWCYTNEFKLNKFAIEKKNITVWTQGIENESG